MVSKKYPCRLAGISKLNCEEILCAKGVNVTPTRIEIVTLFLTMQKSFTMAEIHEHLQTILKSLTLSTVSENLIIMKARGIILAEESSHKPTRKKPGRPAVKYALAKEFTNVYAPCLTPLFCL